MYVVTVVFEVEADAAEAFRARVLRHAALTRQGDAHCHVFDVALDPVRLERIFLYQIYEDESAFEAHLQSDPFKAFDRETASLVIAKTVERFLLVGPEPTAPIRPLGFRRQHG